MKFLKRILGVRKQIVNIAVYGELGRLPLHIIARLRSIRYWLRVASSENSLVNDAIGSQIKNSIPLNDNCWAGKLKHALDCLGFSEYWYFDNLNVKLYTLFYERARDQFIQAWKSQISECRKLISIIVNLK